MPAAAMSSTPARGFGAEPDRSGSSEAGGPNWLGVGPSPMERLNHEMETLLRMDDEYANPDDSILPSSPGPSSPTIQVPTIAVHSEPSPPPRARGNRSRSRSPSSRDKGKGRAKVPGSPMLRNVLKQNMRATAPESPYSRKHLAELKKKNPYIPKDSSAKAWDGIVDVSSPGKRQPVDDEGDQGQPSVGFGDGTMERQAQAQVLKPSTRAPRTMADLGLAPKLGQTPHKAAATQMMNEMLKSIVDSKRKAFSTPFGGPSGRPAQAPTPLRAPAGRAAGGKATARPTATDSEIGAPDSPLRDANYWKRYLPGATSESSASMGTMTPPSAARFIGRAGASSDGTSTLDFTARTPPRAYGDDDYDSPMPTPPSMSKYAHLLAMEDRGEEIKWEDVQNAIDSPSTARTTSFMSSSSAGLRYDQDYGDKSDPSMLDSEDPTDTFNPGGLRDQLRAARSAPSPEPEETFQSELPSATRYQQGYMESPSGAEPSLPSVGRYTQYVEQQGAPTSTFTSSQVPAHSRGSIPLSSAGTVPSAPSFRHLMREVGLDLSGFSDNSSASVQPFPQAAQSQQQQPQQPLQGAHYDNLQGGDDSFDSGHDDSFGDTMRPSTQMTGDQSFESNSSGSSFDDVSMQMQGQAGAAMFAPTNNDGYNDSFDDDSFDNGMAGQVGGGNEETVFGLPPRRAPQGGLMMHGEGLLQDTVQYGQVVDGMEQNPGLATPTPWTNAQDRR
jgi:hypothetical protein